MGSPAEAIRDAEGRKATTVAARAKRIAMYSRIPFAVLVVLMLLSQIGPRPDPASTLSPPDFTEAIAEAGERPLYFVRGGASGYAPEGSTGAFKAAGSGSATNPGTTVEYPFEAPDGIWIDLRVTKGSKTEAMLIVYPSERVDLGKENDFVSAATGNTYEDGEKIAAIAFEDAAEIRMSNDFESEITGWDFSGTEVIAPTLDHLLTNVPEINQSLLILSIQDPGDNGIKAAQILADMLMKISSDQLDDGKETTICDRILVHTVHQSSMDAFRTNDGCPTSTIMTSDEATAYSTWVNRRLDKWWFEPATKFIMPNVVEGASVDANFFADGMGKAVEAREQISISAPCGDLVCIESHEAKAVKIILIDWDADLSETIPVKEESE